MRAGTELLTTPDGASLTGDPHGDPAVPGYGWCPALVALPPG